ncbi:GNAT family N-acetyltransferase [Streptomyces sp. R302]|uniref:GNAT family N-acetyltransferase n=1 Tax=unclassified Streptomyces TaxID=2593676 RepID=UPI00145D23AA|nr:MULTISPECIES: GNAT family N-acetyltransferase [unclassified Streptomyces]NML52641.1 GNAT family N-acetyltransferase [Streptomyces sp. R301]NML80430.1 GNAT family N-acetyltransferase [Streptomyces sp. R302]
MTAFGTDSWPPAPIRTGRLVLREAAARDRPAFVELFASPEVGTYVGGARPRADLEAAMPEVPGRRPGAFVVERDGTMIGVVTLDPGKGGRTDLGYMFLRQAWGLGYAAEACGAVLGWFAGIRPGEPVSLVTQTANVRAMRLAARLGFTEVERYEEYGAEQWYGVRGADAPATPDTSAD